MTSSTTPTKSNLQELDDFIATQVALWNSFSLEKKLALVRAFENDEVASTLGSIITPKNWTVS